MFLGAGSRSRRMLRKAGVCLGAGDAMSAGSKAPEPLVPPNKSRTPSGKRNASEASAGRAQGVRTILQRNRESGERQD